MYLKQKIAQLKNSMIHIKKITRNLLNFSIEIQQVSCDWQVDIS